MIISKERIKVSTSEVNSHDGDSDSSDMKMVVALPVLNTRFREYLSKIKMINQQNNELSKEFAKNYGKMLEALSKTSKECHKKLQTERQIYMYSYAEYLNFSARYKRYRSKCQQLLSKIAMLQDEQKLISDGGAILSERNNSLKTEISSVKRRIRDQQLQNADLKKKMFQLEDDKDEAEDKLKTAEALRVQCQLNTDFIRAEIAFTRTIFDEIITIYKKATQAAVKEGNFSKLQLNKAKSEIRAEFAKRTEHEMQEIAKDYQIQYEQLEHSLKMSTYKYGKDMNDKNKDDHMPVIVNDGDIGDGLRLLGHNIFESQHTLIYERQQNTTLTNKLEILESELENLISKNREERREKDEMVKSYRSRIMEMIMRIHRIKATKFTLQSEIETYRKLLCDEEKRISYFDYLWVRKTVLGFGKFLHSKNDHTFVIDDRDHPAFSMDDNSTKIIYDKNIIFSGQGNLQEHEPLAIFNDNIESFESGNVGEHTLSSLLQTIGRHSEPPPIGVSIEEVQVSASNEDETFINNISEQQLYNAIDERNTNCHENDNFDETVFLSTPHMMAHHLEPPPIGDTIENVHMTVINQNERAVNDTLNDQPYPTGVDNRNIERDDASQNALHSILQLITDNSMVPPIGTTIEEFEVRVTSDDNRSLSKAQDRQMHTHDDYKIVDEDSENENIGANTLASILNVISNNSGISPIDVTIEDLEITTCSEECTNIDYIHDPVSRTDLDDNSIDCCEDEHLAEKALSSVIEIITKNSEISPDGMIPEKFEESVIEEQDISMENMTNIQSNEVVDKQNTNNFENENEDVLSSMLQVIADNSETSEVGATIEEFGMTVNEEGH